LADNTTPHKADDYSREVQKTIPFHAEILAQAIDVGLSVRPDARTWLDTGCGPGTLGEMLLARAPAIELTIADPSEAMLALAKHPEKILSKTQDLSGIGPFDVITAVQCHHYGGRERAVTRCHDLLVSGGVLVVFENVRAETDEGHAIQRKRWAAWQRSVGRSDEEVAQHLAREGTKFFPIRPSEHLDLLRKTGFRVVELFFRAYGQAGFYAVK